MPRRVDPYNSLFLSSRCYVYVTVCLDSRHAYMRTGLFVFLRVEILYKYKVNAKCPIFVSRPKFRILSNDALVFAVSLIF
jgi:hypothetical protein